MQCLKCGREIPLGQVFCEECLADMEKYPVKPGTPIRLPQHHEAAPAKKQHFRRGQLPPETQVKRLRLQLWLVSGLLAAAVMLSAFTIWQSKHKVHYAEAGRAPGQNYSAAPGAATTQPGQK